MKNRKLISIFILFHFFFIVVFAHHFKGLPHFNYFENYPQIPQEEFIGQSGNYEFSLVLYDFQGIKKSDALQPEDARLYLAIYDLIKNKTYQGPLELQILLDGKILYRKSYKSSVEESIYTLQEKLPPTGKYSLKIIGRGESKLTGEIPFVLSAQKIHWGKWIAGVLVLLTIILIVGARKARLIIDRKENNKEKNRQQKINQEEDQAGE